MQVSKPEQKDMLETILDVDSTTIRFVGIIDCDIQTLMSRSQKNKTSHITPKDEEKFAEDLIKIKSIQEKLDNFIGKVLFSHIIRKKLHQVVYYVDNLIIYITCEPNADLENINLISRNVEYIIKNHLYGELSPSKNIFMKRF